MQDRWTQMSKLRREWRVGRVTCCSSIACNCCMLYVVLLTELSRRHAGIDCRH